MAWQVSSFGWRRQRVGRKCMKLSHGQPVKGYPRCSNGKDGGASYSKLIMCIALYGAVPESISQIPVKF